ncbi:lyase family protein [Candidatus Alkanophaga liquidiphilum]
MPAMEKFTSLQFSPTDFRYAVEDLREYLSEEAFIRYKAKVEAALAKVFLRRGLISEEICKEIEEACREVSAAEVYEEERRTKHDIRALVNVIRRKVSDAAKPFVHLAATSYDIVDTANALRLRDATLNVILPDMLALERCWIQLAKREKATLQIGRTHGQHAEPITFGFAIAQYVERWGTRILKFKEAAENLVGKFSGAVGAYNAASLLFDDPEAFEREVLAELKLKPARISTQIVPPEPLNDFIHAAVSAFSVLANFCDDMRHLQRTEISEVAEAFTTEQVGSSTMPHKKNPVTFESVKSLWKRFMPFVVTAHFDQISEHQRDLTNSASQRYIPELLVIFDHCVRSVRRVSEKLVVDAESMRRNFELSKDKIIAEPLYVLLSLYGHPDAHECVRKLVLKAEEEGKSLKEIALEDEELAEYVKKFTPLQSKIAFNSEKYVGIAAKKAEKIADYWEKRLKDSFIAKEKI